jgi:hypothetical protein
VSKNKTLSLLLEDTYHPEHQENQTDKDQQNHQGTVQVDQYGPLSSPVTPTVPLAELLRHGDTPQRIRRVTNSDDFTLADRIWLCLNLAFSLLHLSSGDWGEIIWYSDDPNSDMGIYFLRDPGTQEICDKTNAYMTWRLHEECASQESEGLLCDPQLLDFAQLLIEILHWKKLQVPLYQGSEEFSDQLAGKPPKEQLRLRLLKYIKEGFLPSDFEFTSALKACLSPAGRNEAGDHSKPERIQTYIFQHIVQPLYRYFGQPELPEATIALQEQDRLISQCSFPSKTSLYDSSVGNDKPEDVRFAFLHRPLVPTDSRLLIFE